MGTEHRVSSSVEAEGATYTAEQHELFKLPRPVDIDYDGAGKFYVASWRDGSFSYSHPFVGYVVAIEHTAGKYSAPVDPAKSTTKELLAQLASDSQRTRRNAQLELRQRLFAVTPMLAEVKNQNPPAGMMMMDDAKTALFTQLTDLLFKSSASLETRLAVVPLLSEHWKNANEQEVLDLVQRFETEIAAKSDPLTPWLAVIIGQTPFNQSPSIIPLYKTLLTHDQPTVRLQAVTAAPRLAQSPLLLRMLTNRLSDPDRAVAHLTERAWLQIVGLKTALNGYENPINSASRNPDIERNVIAALGTGLTSEEPAIRTAAARILSQLKSSASVAEIQSALSAKQVSTEQRQTLLTALCRLYFEASPWDGKWWGTRPDTSGPYYGTRTWSETEAIAKQLKSELANASPEIKKHLILNLFRHKIDFPEIATTIRELSQQDVEFRNELVPVLVSSKDMKADQVAVLEQVAKDTTAKPETRALAIQGLCRVMHDQPAYQAGFTALADALLAGPLPDALNRQLDVLTRDGKNKGMTHYLIKQLDTDHRATREIIYGMLIDACEINA